MRRPDTPFPRHWLYYIKITILAAAGALGWVYFEYWMPHGT